ncbi:hypothetical protein AAFF_G00253060 [Aldrovandia affinis]|uniref:Uncharacterized protein n=1 Tax=Aldrovandia affinis TaxID=143900 RepID=A0AAD7WTA5_9TELE|nr:hypothetical protein AAFF_G00253060 [Aldrovandia affinis]
MECPLGAPRHLSVLSACSPAHLPLVSSKLSGVPFATSAIFYTRRLMNKVIVTLSPDTLRLRRRDISRSLLELLSEGNLITPPNRSGDHRVTERTGASKPKGNQTQLTLRPASELLYRGLTVAHENDSEPETFDEEDLCGSQFDGQMVMAKRHLQMSP